jgi:hypothetical protein
MPLPASTMAAAVLSTSCSELLIVALPPQILFLVAATLFLTSDSCPSSPSWYTWLYPLASLVACITAAFLYTMFMLGMAEDNPSLWAKLVIIAVYGT